MLTFGNAGSETAHSLNYTYSDTFSGALGQTARRLLPKPQIDMYGGEMTFTMAVDPVQQNYFTIKLWGSDTNDAQQWFVLDLNGYEVGGRHLNVGAPDMLYNTGVSWFQNCFIYRTTALPLKFTRGKTSVTLKIRSMGWISFYDSGAFYGHYQKMMDAPTLGLYRAYTHAGSIVDTSVETQGSAPALVTPRALEDETTTLNSIKSSVNSGLSTDLNATASSLAKGDIDFLAQCYDAKENLGQSWITYPSGMTVTNLANQVVAAIDAQMKLQATNSSYAAGDWGGQFGAIGDAIRLLWPQLSNSMSATVNFGGTWGSITRKSGWSQGLRASIDAGRFSRRTIANQALFAAQSTYLANRGLQLVDPTNAIIESEALRYPREAAGILPWSGDDQAGGTAQVPVKGTQPYGTNWFMITTKGTSKDGDGFVGSDYGELGPWIYRLGLQASDPQLLSRGIVVAKARGNFRFPASDGDGYLVMQGTEPIGERNNGLPGHWVYLGRTFSEDFAMAAAGPAAVGTNVIGYLQEEMNDGQLLRMISGMGDPYLPMRYSTIKSFAQTGVKLPMAPGQPDFAWVDEENMVVAAKHGEERIFANLYWRQPTWINGFAKVFHMTTNIARLADVQVVDESFKSTGGMTILGPDVDYNPAWTAPMDMPTNADFGTPALIAMRSDLTNAPSNNRDAGRGTGYTFRYGNWLVGINANYPTNILGQSGSNYVVQLPSNFTTATDMISGQVMSAPIVLAPKTSVVFYLPTNVDPNPPPARPLFIMASGANGRVAVSWTAAGGATAYNVKRSTASGSGYVTVAGGVTNLFYTDTAVVNGTTYYYVVSSTNTIGESGNSPEDSATPVAPQTAGLPAPWANTNFTYSGGSATISGGTFTLNSTQGDMWGSSDACHFVFQPMIGDGVVVAQVLTSSSANTYAKAGLMIRDSLASNSVSCAINIERVAGRAEMDYRSSYGGSTSQATYGGLTLPYWVKLQRAGSTVTTYVSPNGTNWTTVGSVTLSGLGYVAYVGMATAPASGSGANTATFSNVSFPLGATVTPGTPAGLTASGGNTFATFAWSPMTNAVSYNLKRGTSAGGPFTTVVSGIVNPSVTDFGLSNGVSYFYVVSAVNDVGESANSSVVSVAGTLPLSAPANIWARATNAQVAVNWNAVPGATGYNVYRAVWNIQDPRFAVIAANVSGTNYTDTAVANSTAYCYFITSLTNASESQWSAQAAASPPGVPAPWQTVDIGVPSPAGYAYQSGTNFIIAGGGSDIYNTGDQCRYVYQPMAGNCSVIAHVNALNAPDAWTKCGVMIRQSTEGNSAFVDVVDTGSYGLVAQARSSSGASAWQIGSAAGYEPIWLRLTRTNNVFTASYSADGTNWTTIGSPQTVTMTEPVLVGLPISSHVTGQFATATIDTVTVAGATPVTPSVPQNPVATAGNAIVTLNWLASSNYPSGYNVKRSLIDGGPYATVAFTSATNLVDSGLVNGTTYFYVISSTNSVGESANSVQVAATPSVNSGGNVVWSGNLSTNWDVNMTANWLSNGVSAVYLDGFGTRFDDTATTNIVNLVANVTPSGIVISNVAKSYTLSSTGGFGIQGATGLTKLGAGTLYFQAMNSGFVSGVTIGGGKVQLNNGAAGSTHGELGFGNVLVTNGGWLQLQGQGGSGTVYPVYFTNAVTFNGGNLYGADGGQHLTGPITIGPNGVGMTESQPNKYIYLDGIVSGNGTITNPIPGSSAGSFGFGPVYFQNSSNTYSGTFILNNGGLGITDPNGTALANATLNLVGYNSGQFSAPVAFSSRVITLGSLVGALNFPMGIVTNLVLGNNNANAVYSGAVMGTNGTTKIGTGIQYLFGTNTYTGATVVSNGELVVSTKHLGGGNFLIGDAGTLGVTNSVAQSATISNLIFSVTGGATLELFNVNSTTVAPIIASNLTVNGASTIKITGGTLAIGSTYPLINYSGAFNGSFGNLNLQMPSGTAGVLVSNANQIALAVVGAPSTPTSLTALAGDAQVALSWNAATNASGYYLKRSVTSGGPYAVVAGNYVATNFADTGLVDGVLYFYVVSATNAAGVSASSVQVSARPTSAVSPQVAVSVNGGQLQFSWPATNTGWLVQVQTNASSSGLGTNWTTLSDSGGTNQYTAPLDPQNGNVFFRLAHP